MKTSLRRLASGWLLPVCVAAAGCAAEQAEAGDATGTVDTVAPASADATSQPTGVAAQAWLGGGGAHPYWPGNSLGNVPHLPVAGLGSWGWGANPGGWAVGATPGVVPSTTPRWGVPSSGCLCSAGGACLNLRK
jgi:hypothetical protein